MLGSGTLRREIGTVHQRRQYPMISGIVEVTSTVTAVRGIHRTFGWIFPSKEIIVAFGVHNASLMFRGTYHVCEREARGHGGSGG